MKRPLRLPAFLRENVELIAEAWTKLAQSRGIRLGMNELALANDINRIVLALAVDMDRRESASHPGARREARAASPWHNLLSVPLRFHSYQLVSELVSLRETVLQQWQATARETDAGDLADVGRFDEALDELLVESLRELGRSKDDAMNLSLAVIGHDLRNSLSALSMASNILARSANLPTALARPVGGLQNTTARMKHMVNDLVDLAQVRLGKGMPLERVEVDLEAICRGALAEVQAIHPDFSVEFSASGDLKGRWDGVRIGQAVANLANHAAQFGSFRSPIVVRAEGGAGEVVLSVGNLGMPEPSQLRAFFDPLLQLRPQPADDKDDTSGFRLGLYIAREIVTAHGGTLEVSAAPAQGTTFIVRLPRHSD